MSDVTYAQAKALVALDTRARESFGDVTTSEWFQLRKLREDTAVSFAQALIDAVEVLREIASEVPDADMPGLDIHEVIYVNSIKKGIEVRAKVASDFLARIGGGV